MDSSSNSVSENMVDAMNEVLQVVTGSIGVRVHQLSTELASAVDGSQTDRLLEVTRLLAQTSAQLEATKQKFGSHGHYVSECTEDISAAKAGMLEATGTLRQTLREIAVVDPAKEKREQGQSEMLRRNRQFEEKLRAEHQEFVQRHAKRLTRILQ